MRRPAPGIASLLSMFRSAVSIRSSWTLPALALPALALPALAWFVLVFAGLGLAVPSPAWAQDPATAEDEGGASASETQEVEVEPVPEDLRSARATMRTFLEAFDPQKAPEGWNPLDRGAYCLDLSELPKDLVKQQGRELAAALKEVLDRTLFIDFAAISDDPDAEPWVLEVETDGKDGEVVLAADDTGRWLFTAETVDALPNLLKAVRDQEVVEGVTESGPLTLSQRLRSWMPTSLLAAPLLLENWQWLGLVLLLVLGLTLDQMVTRTVKATIQGYLSRRMERIDPAELHHALRPLGLLTASLVWWPGLFWLALPTEILTILVVAVKFIATTAFVWTAYRMVDIAAAVFQVRAERSENKFDDLLVPLFRKSAKIFVGALGFVFIADNLDVDITSLVAGLGIGGLAVALAAQDAVRNLFGSLMVILDQPFSVGDWVVIGDVEGTVVELGFRSTKIRTFYDSTITLPNANLISASVDNLGARTYRRWKTMLSLTYDTPAGKVEAFCEGVRELIRLHPYTRKDSYQVYLNQFSASSVDVLVYMFFLTPDWATELRERHRLMLDIMRLAQSLGVDFAFDTRTVVVQRPGELDPLAAFDGYGDHVDGLRGKARDEARALVDGALAGETPPPVGG